jgi:hypothetical protein
VAAGAGGAARTDNERLWWAPPDSRPESCLSCTRVSHGIRFGIFKPSDYSLSGLSLGFMRKWI